MKKVFAILMIAVIMLTCVIAVSAADFTPSVTGKDAPEVVTNDDGSAGVIKDKSGNVVGTVDTASMAVTSYADKAESTQANQVLTQAYTDLNNGTVQDKLSEGLKSYAESVTPGLNEESLVVSDLFYLEVSDETKAALEGDNYLEVVFDIGIAAGDKAPAVVYACDGTNWEMVDPANVKNNGDGTITVKFNTLCPIAFMSVPAGAEPAPQPASTTQVSVPGLIILIVVAALVGAGLVVLIYLIKALKAA